jgi:hypothetical protein
MAKNTHDAGPSADAPDGAAGIASAGGRGEGADVTSSQGNVDTHGGNIFDILGGNTVAAQMDAMAKADGLSTGPAPKRATAKAQQAPAKPKRTALADAEDEDEADDTTAEDEQEETGADDGPILPEDESDATDETEDEATSTDDGEDGDDDTPTQELAKKAKALEKDNFKNREKLREARAAIEEKEARIKELEQQAQEGNTTVNGLPAGFEQARTLADIDILAERYEQALEWAEDHEDGYVGKDAQGEEVEWTPQQVRDYRRNMARLAKGAAKARDLIQQSEEKRSKSVAEARKKYPFVFDATSSRQSLVKEIETEFEAEIKASPARDLLLGRLTVAKLIESGKYVLVPKSKPKAKADAEERPTAKVSQRTPASSSPARKAPRPPATDGEDWAMSLARISMPHAA